MNLFTLLPADIQRIICWILSEYKEIKKVSPPFYDNPNDVYWKQKVSTVTSQKTPEETTHRDFYESFVYEKYLRHQEWNIKLFPSMVNDEVFLMRHVNAQSRSGCTALMYAARYSKEEEVKLLLASGADVNLSNNAQYTALMNAANNSTIKIVKLLLDAGADVNRKNYEGGTALFSACFAAQEKIIKLLISTGADINIRDNCNHTALSYTTNKKIRALLTPS